MNEPAESEKGAVVCEHSFQSTAAGLEDVLCCLTQNIFQLNAVSLSHAHGHVPLRGSDLILSDQLWSQIQLMRSTRTVSAGIIDVKMDPPYGL